MTRPKVCFLGNCQAQAFQSLSGHLGLEVEVLLLPPNFQANEGSRAVFEAVYKECDFIFNQRVDDGFKLDFVRREYLHSKFPGKAVSWPNMYFDGYFPGIRYVYNGLGQKLVGPLSEYHVPEIISGWKAGRPADEIAKEMQEGTLFSDPHPVESSLQNLMMREQGLDCTISDFIRERFRSRRLFYSMNHPTNELLMEMMRRLFAAAGIPFEPKNNIATYAYTLDQVILPTYGYFRKKYRPIFDDGSSIKSFSIDATGKQRDVHLNWQEVVDSFYRAYNSVKYNL